MKSCTLPTDRVTGPGEMLTLESAGTGVEEIVMVEVACRDPPLSVAVTVRNVNPAVEPAVNVVDALEVENRFPNVLLRDQL